MLRTIAITFAAITAFAALAVKAAEGDKPFVAVDATNDWSRAIFLDVNSVKVVSGNKKLAWFFQVYNGKDISENIKSAKSLMYFDCGNRTYTYKNITLYSGDTKLIGSKSYESFEMKWEDVIPDTIAENQYLNVCDPPANASDMYIYVPNSSELEKTIDVLYVEGSKK